jgi:hypothetical protein
MVAHGGAGVDAGGAGDARAIGHGARVDIHIAWTSQHFGAGGIDAQIKTPTGGADAFGQKWNHEITLAVPGTEIGKRGGDRR